jgi:hypothetical protein
MPRSLYLLLFQLLLVTVTFWFARATEFHDMTFVLTVGWMILSLIIAIAMLALTKVDE